MTKSKIIIELPALLSLPQALEVREIIRAAMEAYASNNLLVLAHVQRVAQAAYPNLSIDEREKTCNAEAVKWRCELARLIGSGFVDHRLVDE